MPSDSFAVVVNEATVRALGLEDPLNTRFKEPDDNGEEVTFKRIIGVVKDFHFASMQSEIGPMAMHFMRGNREGFVTIRLGDGSPPKRGQHPAIDGGRVVWRRRGRRAAGTQR